MEKQFAAVNWNGEIGFLVKWYRIFQLNSLLNVAVKMLNDPTITNFIPWPIRQVWHNTHHQIAKALAVE